MKLTLRCLIIFGVIVALQASAVVEDQSEKKDAVEDDQAREKTHADTHVFLSIEPDSLAHPAFSLSLYHILRNLPFFLSGVCVCKIFFRAFFIHPTLSLSWLSQTVNETVAATHFFESKMSWQDYVDKQLLASGFVNHAAIIGNDGALWAKSAAFNVTPAELSTFASNYSSPEFFQANGITLSGTRFIFLSGTDRVLRAKKNKSGLHCMKTEKAIVVSIYEEPTTPQQAANVVEKLGDYLMGHGY